MVDNRLNMPNQPLRSVRPEKANTQSPKVRKPEGTSSFKEVLGDQLKAQSLKFSAHAIRRMSERNISLSERDMTRLEGAVDRALSKGARESLVMMDDKAFVVSVKNRTIITAVDGESAKENVFTNIDSAVIT